MSAALEHGIITLLEDSSPEDALAALAAVKARLYFRELQRSHLAPGQSTGSQRLLTANEVAGLVGVSLKWVYARKAFLGAVMVGRNVRFPEARIRAYLKTGD